MVGRVEQPRAQARQTRPFIARGSIGRELFKPLGSALHGKSEDWIRDRWDPGGNQGFGKWDIDIGLKHQFYLFQGRAGTGKSMAIGEWVRVMCERFPGLRVLVLRLERARLTNSWMVTWEDKVLGPGHPALGGRKREGRSAYYFPVGWNGRQSTVVLMDLSDPEKTFSSEWDIILINEVVEIPSADNVSALWRGVRGGVGPVQAIIMDCNPGNEFHWANQWAIKGTIARFDTTWKDNPLYWSRDNGKWKLDIETTEWTPVESGAGYTEAGRKYISPLGKNLTPEMRRRLYLGEWGSAIGRILHTFTQCNVVQMHVSYDTRRHTWVIGMPPGHPLGEVDIESWVVGYDWGDASPGAMQLWGVDKGNRMYMVHEVYRTRKNADWWADIAYGWHEKYTLDAIYCDDAAIDAIYLFNKRFASKNKKGEAFARAAKKGHVEPGNDRVRFMMMDGPTDKPGVLAPRLYINEFALQEGEDPALENKPTCTRQEIPGYVYRDQGPKDPVFEVPARDSADHGIDAMRYAVINIARLDGWEERADRKPVFVDHYGRPLAGFEEMEELVP